MSRFKRDMPVEFSLTQKLAALHWPLIVGLVALAGVGFAMLYSVAQGSLEPWAMQQMIRFGIGLVVVLVVAVVDIRVWFNLAYVFYALVLLALVLVAVMGEVSMGARRWLDIAGFQFQPSEVVKIFLVLALARYFHDVRPDKISHPAWLVAPVILVLLPVILVLRQPDLGTAVLIAMSGLALFFLAGVSWRYFAGAFIAALAAIPIGWQFLLPYQRNRIYVLFNPEADLLDKGYHIHQSKIAFGAGGVWGKGFMEGTQSHLNFLPEKHTDFIFTVLAEEVGLMGSLGVLALYMAVIGICVAMSLRCKAHYARLVSCGVAATVFFYVLTNVAMVSGLIPVVGVPLPLISYGGTVMLSLMIGFGLVMNSYIHRDVDLGHNHGIAIF